MNKGYILLLMIFCHIFDDYYLQGILASMKQRTWWEKNAPEKMYKHDYLPALFAHAFSWTFMIMLPIAWYYNFQLNILFYVVFVSNIICHAFVDHQKANIKTINLIIDQISHLFMILLTFLWLIVA